MHTTTIINFITFSLASLAAAAPVDPAVTNPTPTAAAGSPSPRSVEGGLARRELKAQCNYKNAVFMDVYTIFGRDYAGTGPGQGGEHVRNNLKGCGGTLSGFKFKPKADDAPEGAGSGRSTSTCPSIRTAASPTSSRPLAEGASSAKSSTKYWLVGWNLMVTMIMIKGVVAISHVNEDGSGGSR
ncbi:hypothetical protein PG995_011725 [Apiospora arundinis]